jgi:uncharacterized protein YkwD
MRTVSVNIHANLAGDGLEQEEVKLYQLVNQYRAQNGLPPVRLSKALSIVANRHMQDLAENVGQVTHSWSDATYDPSNPSTYPTIWAAPQRLNTGYSGYGFEVVDGYSGFNGPPMLADVALEDWKHSASHNAVILNQGMWKDYQWNAVGVGIYKGYAALWFGKESDSTGLPNSPTINGVFDEQYYLARNPDVAAAVSNHAIASGFEHFLLSGLDEGRQSSRLFDVRYYLANNPDLRASGFSYRQAFEHFQSFGLTEGRKASPLFDARYYLDNNPDLRASGFSYRQAFEHFQSFGLAERRSGNVSTPVVPGNSLRASSVDTDTITGLNHNHDVLVGGQATDSFTNSPSGLMLGQTHDGVIPPVTDSVFPLSDPQAGNQLIGDPAFTAVKISQGTAAEMNHPMLGNPDGQEFLGAMSSTQTFTMTSSSFGLVS